MGKVAFLFAGQGSQYVGMGKSLYENNQAAKKIADIADSITGNMMKDVCFNGDIETLSKTKYTQPCMFVHECMCVEALKEKGIKPDGVAGFSLGEYGALYCSGCFDFESGLDIVIKRGQFMDECANNNPGKMIAVLGLLDEEVESFSKEAKVFPVNYNCEGQLVLAGEKENIEKAVELFKETKAKVRELNVSGGFHSPLMNDASDKLYDYLDSVKINEPQIPLYANVTGNILLGDVKENMAKQIKSPVLWKQTIKNMIENGYDTFIEIGAGKTLKGLMRKISKDVQVYNVDDMDSIKNLELK